MDERKHPVSSISDKRRDPKFEVFRAVVAMKIYGVVCTV